MTETVDIVTFLRARLDEDEQAARRAGSYGRARWEYDRERFHVVAPGVDPACEPAPSSVAIRRMGPLGRFVDAHPGYDPLYDVDGEHIARHNPARVLAEVAAKRAILGMCVRPPEDDGDGALWVPGGGGYGEAWVASLLALVQVHAGHPDFDPAWRLP